MMNAPASPRFNNMNELTTYLTSLERRVAGLELENEELIAVIKPLENRIVSLELENKTLHSGIDQVLKGDLKRLEKGGGSLPNTMLISDSFLSRAFAVWGHYFVAQLIISIPMIICYFILLFMMASSNTFQMP
jgi:hypothetical protein